MSSKGQRIIVTCQTKQESPLPTCNPNLMPFHIKHTGPAPVSMFLRVDKMTADEETRMNERSISSFRGRTIHGLTVDVPTGYTGLLLHGDPQPNVTYEVDRVTSVLNAEVNSGLPEGEDEQEKVVVDSGTEGGRNTRSKSKGVVGNGKGKGKAKANETTKATPKGRLARTAVPKLAEVITVEMADPAPTELATVSRHPLELTNHDTNALDGVSNDTEGIPLRRLIPQSTFSSITLWHADRVVDETRDEYHRTLTEWMALSHEVSICVTGYM